LKSDDSLLGVRGSIIELPDIRGTSIVSAGPICQIFPDRVRAVVQSWLWIRASRPHWMPTVFFGGKVRAGFTTAINFQMGPLGLSVQGSKMELPSLAPPSDAIVPGSENPRFTPKIVR
jgi:hypothetical protein